MDNIAQIMYETIWVSTPEFIRIAFAGMAGGFLGAYVNDRLTRKRDKDSGVTTEKLVLVPLIKELIVTTKNCAHLLGDARAMIWPKLHISVSRFQVRLEERKSDMRPFNTAWETLNGTTRDECPTQQPNTSDEVYAKQKKLLLSRLEAFKKAVQDS